MPKSKAAHLDLRVTAVEEVVNERLTSQFYQALRHLQEMGFNPPDRSAILTVYHGTHQSNIPAIVDNNLSIEKKGQLDSGWLGAGLYFSQHADNVMAYMTTSNKFNDVKAGQSGKLLQFDILPGRMNRLANVKEGVSRELFYDSHVTPNGFEYVLFDARHVRPRYVISFNVEAAAGASFEGSVEQNGPI